MFPRNVQDKIVQYPGRYQLTNVATGQVLGTFDLEVVPGVITEPGTAINKAYLQPIEDALMELLMFANTYYGRASTYQWNAQGLPDWAKHCDGAGGTGNLIKRIDYVWNSQGLPDSETYLFYDYSPEGVLLKTRQCTVTYAWNSEGLPTLIDVSEILEVI